ncbi:MAG TPA: DUF3768 domain-containing protein [Pseudorhizobium sp.]|jgi:hypothetical protein|nr:DUF3768 domain-containing protein [Pseudorhizobium sp.]
MSDRAIASSPPDNTVAALNDALRQSFANGHVVLTDGVAALPECERRAVLRAVQAFGAFTADNDPYGEHDFGAFEHAGTRYFWKIDYYDRDLTCGSPDPADPAVTKRLMTVMRADEY